MSIFKNIKQFFFASFFFIAAITIHFNFMMVNQDNALAQSNLKKSNSDLSVSVTNEKLALNEKVEVLNL